MRPGLRLLTLPTVAPMIGVSRRRIYELAAQGELPGLRRLGKRSLRVSADALEAWLAGTLSTAHDVPPAA